MCAARHTQSGNERDSERLRRCLSSVRFRYSSFNLILICRWPTGWNHKPFSSAHLSSNKRIAREFCEDAGKAYTSSYALFATRDNWCRVTKIWLSFVFENFGIFVIKDRFLESFAFLINWQNDPICQNNEGLDYKRERSILKETDNNNHHYYLFANYLVLPGRDWMFEKPILFFSPQTWFFTDTDDDDFQQRLNGRLINTKCPKGHSRRALCCKMAAELNTFLEHRKKWVELLIYGRKTLLDRAHAVILHALRFNFQ